MTIAISSLTRDYGDLRALDHLTLEVAAGEIYGLLGPNGAGKTTTIRILAGLLVPSSGEARVMGVTASEDALSVKRSLGYLTGDTALYGRLTPREVLRFFARLNDRDEGWIAARIDALAADLDLAGFLDRRCDRLSTGQRQRTAIARALVHDPPVLVLDEPTASLDVVSARFILDRLRAEAARGKAVLFSTHHLSEAELVCHRIGVLHRGRLLAEGRAGELLERTRAATLTEAFLALVDAAA